MNKWMSGGLVLLFIVIAAALTSQSAHVNSSGRCAPYAACSIGDSTVTSFTITTDGTGEGEFEVPDQSIGTAEIENESIVGGDIASGAVDTTELAAGAVTFAKQDFVTIGASPAATCTAGSIHIDTDETVDTNCTTLADNSLCLCTATDTWTVLENN